MAESAETSQDLDYRLATGDQISWASKVYLHVVISEEYHLSKMGTTCYFVTGLYRADFWFAISFKTLVDWVEENRGYLSHPTLTTIPIPPPDLPVHPSRLRSTRSHIAPQFLVI